MEWATCTCTLGWEVQGVWPLVANGTEVNAMDRSHAGSLLVSADSKGRLSLFNYPASARQAQASVEAAHKSHATCVRFGTDDKYVMSTGGKNMCVLQWGLA